MPVPFREEAGRAWIKLQHGHAAGDRGWTFAMVEIRSGTASGGVGIT